MSLEDTPKLEGSVARVVYSNPENHWTVLRMTVRAMAREQTVVGTLAGVREGEHLRVWGDWVEDARFGRQLRAQRFQVVLPATAEGIERYLGSGLIPGIGPKTAKLIVKRFGAKTFDVIEKNPERLKVVKGIGRKKVTQLLRVWRDQTQLRDSMSFLLTLGITPALAAKIFKQYGVEAVGRVKANPYDLAQDVWGIGFLRADRIARKLEIGPDDPARLRAGLVHVLKEARGEGHVCLPRERLLEAGQALLDIEAGLLGNELGILEGLGRVMVEQPDDLVYTPDLYAAERRAADNMARLLDSPAAKLPDAQIELLIRQAESTLGVDLAETQRDAVYMALTSRVSVITGGPGTGKTTIVRAVVEALEAMKEEVALAAPTDRAAKRLGASTRREARTIHRLLEWQPTDADFTRDEHNPLAEDAVVLDEVSMVDIQLIDSVLRALGDGARLVLVGDVDQLPSVGPGAVLADIIRSETVPLTRLSEIFRQASGSSITQAAHRFLQGELPEPPEPGRESDFYWIDKDDPEAIRGILCKLLTQRIPAAFNLDARRDVQVLTPMHRGQLGSEGLNELIGSLLNAGRADVRLAPGDKVMQIRNNYEKEVFNGDVGFVIGKAEDGRTLMVRFDELAGHRVVHYEPQDQDQLIRAWAISIHKSQGSEYPCIIVPLHTQHFMMLRRNLVYTAVTRGKSLVVLIGSRKALRMAVSAATVRPRYGLLAQRLRELAR